MAVPPTSKPNPILGSVLRAERERQGVSQEALAGEAGLTTHAIGRLERGHSDPLWSSVESVIEALNLTLIELAQRIEDQR